MKIRTHIHKFATQLLKISYTDHLLDDDKISAVLKSLPRSQETLIVLQEYYNLIQSEKLKEHLFITAAAHLSDGQMQKLKCHFEKKFRRNLRVTFSYDPQLIAGIKVQIGDKIFERSIQSTLSLIKD